MEPKYGYFLEAKQTRAAEGLRQGSHFLRRTAITTEEHLAQGAPPQRRPSKLHPDADRLRSEAGKPPHDVT